MLRKARPTPVRPPHHAAWPRRPGGAGGHFAIVASQYNSRYVNSMLRAARQTLRAAGAQSVRVVRVPGAWEIPVTAARLARSPWPPLSAIICLGVILRGETWHAQLIAEAVTAALMRIHLRHEVPVVHEVLLLENKAQALARCLDPERNRGFEAAQTALQMARVVSNSAFGFRIPASGSQGATISKGMAGSVPTGTR